MIHFNRVSKRYANGHSALLNINFQLGKGEMAFLTGHSGAGKSTLLKLIAMMEKPSVGEVILNGVNLQNMPARMIPYLRRNIGLIFQNPNLLPERTLLENVALPLIISGYRDREIEKRAQAALGKVGLLKYANQLPETLSAGEEQRVGIARAIVTKPALILADEPTGNLDPDLSKDIMHMFEQFNQLGTTVLIATHDLAVIESMGCRRLELKQGQLVNE